MFFFLCLQCYLSIYSTLSLGELLSNIMAVMSVPFLPSTLLEGSVHLHMKERLANIRAQPRRRPLMSTCILPSHKPHPLIMSTCMSARWYAVDQQKHTNNVCGFFWVTTIWFQKREIAGEFSNGFVWYLKYHQESVRYERRQTAIKTNQSKVSG